MDADRPSAWTQRVLGQETLETAYKEREIVPGGPETDKGGRADAHLEAQGPQPAAPAASRPPHRGPAPFPEARYKGGSGPQDAGAGRWRGVQDAHPGDAGLVKTVLFKHADGHVRVPGFGGVGGYVEAQRAGTGPRRPWWREGTKRREHRRPRAGQGLQQQAVYLSIALRSISIVDQHIQLLNI